jgi:UDP-N-acetylmuramoyl-tripeptide--D-alanyl-D-alanine ligase
MSGVVLVVVVWGFDSCIVGCAKAAGAEAIFLATPEEAGAWLRENLRAGDAVLLKASRGVRLERALETLRRTE